MATNITSSLFGLDPAEYLQQRNRADEQAALSYARLDPVQQAQQGLFQAGQSLARAGGDLFGMQDPQLKKMQAIQALSKNFDLSNPDGYSQFAQALSAGGFQNEAMKAIQIGQSLAEKESMIGYRKAQAEKLAQPGSKIGKMIEERDALVEKYGPNDPRVQAIDQVIYKEGYIKPAKGKGGGGDGFTPMTGGAGGGGGQQGKSPFPTVVGTDKIGRVKLSDGRTMPSSVFYEQQKVTNETQYALDLVNSIDQDTVNKAYGSAADYTELPYGGKIRPETTTAQSTIKSLKIKDTLEKLGPLKGSTSDREFTTIMSSFPKFTDDPMVMNKWLEKAKPYLEKRVRTNKKQYGVMSTEEDMGMAPPPPSGGGQGKNLSDDDLVNKYKPKK